MDSKSKVSEVLKNLYLMFHCLTITDISLRQFYLVTRACH